MKTDGRSLADISGEQYFRGLAAKFAEATSHYASQGLNPGGIYEGIWTRDASFIIQDWFYSGKNAGRLLDAIMYVWSHQIITNNKDRIPITKAGSKIIYGRGSPDLGYCMTDPALLLPRHSFEGALPTTIFPDFAEVYGQRPDIDSTALMISAASLVLTGLVEKYMAETASGGHYGSGHGRVPYDYLLRAIDNLIPRLRQAVSYLERLDIDNDGLLEQGYNEDWMDTALRSGNVVYSQASWLLALRSLYSLLSIVGYPEQAREILGLAKRTIQAVETKLWSEQDGCYIDSLYLFSDGKDSARNVQLTQDVCLYMVALSEYLDIDGSKQFSMEGREYVFEGIQIMQVRERAHRSLDAIRRRIWSKNEFEWPLVTENALEKTGPRILGKHEYHSHAFWPWITGIEMLARSRFGRLDECLSLISTVAAPDGPKDCSLFEWVDPNTMAGNGAVPFRTGISSLRLAIADCIARSSKAIILRG